MIHFGSFGFETLFHWILYEGARLTIWIADKKFIYVFHSRIQVSVISVVSNVASILGIVLMHIWYAPKPSCSLSILFITLTLALLQIIHSFIEVCNRKAEAAANSDWLTVVVRVHKLFHVILTECWELKQAFIEVPKFKLFVKYTEIPAKPFILLESDLNSAFLTVLCTAILVIAMATLSTGIDSKCFQICFSRISMDFFLG